VPGTGVDPIAAQAGVTKRTLYQHFGSKDQLVAEALSERSRRALFNLEAGARRRSEETGELAILAFFDVIENALSTKTKAGCAFINASLEINYPGHPIREAALAHLRAREELVRQLLVEAGADDADLAAQVVLLVDGAYAVGGSRRDPAAARDGMESTPTGTANGRGIDVGGLKGVRGQRSDSIRFGPSAYGIERLEVYLSTCAFEPHRHDTYAIGITTAGIQRFHYRGSRRTCLPGQLHVLHPDEAHDGAAGTDTGFGYRILYIPPELVREALSGRALPFVGDPIQPLVPTAGRIASLLSDIDEPINELSSAEIAVAVADGLVSLSGCPERRPAAINVRAV